MAEEKAKLYTDNVLLKREIEELKIKASSKSMAHICMQDDADTYYIQLEEYRKLQSAVHSDIEKVWMYDATLTKDLSAYQRRKRSEAIERVFYKIANKWID
jgi:ABC-type siderophore export system fused ATPase/permease subunit